MVNSAEAQDSNLPPASKAEMEEWLQDVDDISSKIKDICDGTVTDFDAFDMEMDLKKRAREIKEEEAKERVQRTLLYGSSGKGAGDKYIWWCRRCHVEYVIDLTENKCTRCAATLVAQADRRKELLARVEDYKQDKVKHQWRKDKWLRWKKSQTLLRKSKVVNYKAWEYWEPESDEEEDPEPIVPKDDPQFQAMEADIKQRNAKHRAKRETAERFREKGNACMTEHDYLGAIENYEEGLGYQKDNKKLWNNKALAELKMFRYEDAVTSCSRVLELAEIFEDGYQKSKSACLKALLRRAAALRGLQKWAEALEDLKDALELEPKDKEARALHEKTKVAAEEARRARRLRAQEEQEEERVREEKARTAKADDGAELLKVSKTDNAVLQEHDPLMEAAACPEPRSSTPSVGPVRVAIEEDSEEEEEEDEEDGGEAGIGGGYAVSPKDRADEHGMKRDSGASSRSRDRKKRLPKFGSLSELKERDFKDLLSRLGQEEDLRVLFSVRTSSVTPEEIDVQAEREKMRSRKAKVEEITERSALDVVLKDLERCCVLWRKSRGLTGVALHHTLAGGGAKETPQEQGEEKEMVDFLARVPKRALAILHTLASNSDHLCELCAPGVKHAWPLLGDDALRYSVLELLEEWSQRPVSVRQMVDFARRYPSPHLELVIEGLTKESKENILPPRFEEAAKAAGERIKRQADGATPDFDKAYDEILQAMSAPSVTDLSMVVLGNLLIGASQHSRTAGMEVKKLMLAHAENVVAAIARRLKPNDWKTCDKAASLLCNLVIGFDEVSHGLATAVSDKCLVPLLHVLREDKTTSPRHKGRVAKLLAALMNLVSVNKEAREMLVRLKALTTVVPFLTAYREGESSTDGPEDLRSTQQVAWFEISVRAGVALSKVLGDFPDALQAEEAVVLRFAEDVVSRPDVLAELAKKREETTSVKLMDVAVRLLTQLLTRSSGILQRLAEVGVPKIEEITEEDHDVEQPTEDDPSLPSLDELKGCLFAALQRLKPTEYVSEEEPKVFGMLRGNLALLFGHLVVEQGKPGQPQALDDLDLRGCVGIFIECLRREREESARHNVGVCVTKLAASQRYREAVRNLHGFESLHQVHLADQQKKKESDVLAKAKAKGLKTVQK